jgi:signal transduction histidine kinase
VNVEPEPAVESGDESPLALLLGQRLRGAREEIVRHWLERITARVAVRPNAVFPTDELLNHVPLLVDGIADYLERTASLPDEETPVTAKAMELGALRHTQGFDAYEILKEYELLGGVVFTFLRRALAEPAVAPFATPEAITDAWERVAHVVELIRQSTMAHFLRLSAQEVREREDRLRRFNRMVSHELKNRVGAISGAAALLSEPWTEGAQRDRFVRMVSENAAGLKNVLDNLVALSRVQGDARQQRNVLLPQAAAEVARQLREAADVRDVTVTVDPSMPPVEVDAAVVELCLTNYLSNAIKYADPAKAERWARIEGELRYSAPNDGGAAGTHAAAPARGELIIRVRDNGLGVPEAQREQLFQQFYRAHQETVTDVAGTGLGLSIVRETVESLGGRAWVEFPDEGGTVFAVAFPSRREEDAAAAGTHRIPV